MNAAKAKSDMQLAELDAYRPCAEWYLHNPSGIHGLGHAARVLVWADRIARWMSEQGKEVDLEAVRWAASLHDVRRIDDGRDSQHGERAADWIRAGNPAEIEGLDDCRRNRIAYCCRWHVPHDEQAPQMTPELICLKDADGLDRVRLGDLNSDFLRTQGAINLCRQAQELHDLSVSAPALNPWEAVRAAARRMGLWRG